MHSVECYLQAVIQELNFIQSKIKSGTVWSDIHWLHWYSVLCSGIMEQITCAQVAYFSNKVISNEVC